MTTELMTQLGYVLAAGLFIFGLKMLGSPATARRGNMISAIGMLVAIVSALLDQGIVDFTYIAAGMVVGGAIGAIDDGTDSGREPRRIMAGSLGLLP